MTIIILLITALWLAPQAILINAGTLRAADPGNRDTPARLKKHATLLFHDAFEREETGSGEKDIGNGWTSATADRVPGKKQADLDGGVLKVTFAPESGHPPHIHHDAGFRDGAAVVRFKLPELSKSENLTVGFVDRECPGVHAGHICYLFINSNPPRLILMDKKTGVSDLRIKARRDALLAAKEKLPPDLEALLATKTKEFPWKADHEWHEIVLVTEGDEMRVSLDGKFIGSHRSEGFAHPEKRWFSLGINPTAWIDDVKVFKLR